MRCVAVVWVLCFWSRAATALVVRAFSPQLNRPHHTVSSYAQVSLHRRHTQDDDSRVSSSSSSSSKKTLCRALREEEARSEIRRKNEGVAFTEVDAPERDSETRTRGSPSASKKLLPLPLLAVERSLQAAEDILAEANVLAQKISSLGGVSDSQTTKLASGTKTPRGDAANAVPVLPGTRRRRRRKVVILGSGWAAASLLKAWGPAARLDDVTVISPRNFFLFTPMLCGAAVGTVEYRSITEPLRKLNAEVDYLEATATRVDVERRRVRCEAVVCTSSANSCQIDDFEVPYDVCVSAVGATTNTFNVPGVREHCLFLKQIADAEKLRQAVGNALERANLPLRSVDEKRADLSFVVVGAGPTGVEFVSELRDFLQTEASKFYPELVPFVSVTLLEATNAVLPAFDEALRDVALDELRRPRPAKASSPPKNKAVSEEEEEEEDDKVVVVRPVDVRLGAAVKAVNETHVILSGENQEEVSVPYGACVWAAGNAPVRVVSTAIDDLGAPQTDVQRTVRGRLATDAFLRVKGAPRGDFFALGDCGADLDAPLPATAQVAAQQGEYLARLLAAGYDLSSETPARSLLLLQTPHQHQQQPTKTLGEAFCDVRDDAVLARPFQFLDLGILTYLGDSKALAQLGGGFKGSGRVAFALWRSVYLAKQMSLRNRLLIGADWVRGRIFGRDITRF